MSGPERRLTGASGAAGSRSGDVYDRYADYMWHALHCDNCEFGEVRCRVAKDIWAAYMSARSPARA